MIIPLLETVASSALTFAGALDGALRGAVIGGCVGGILGGGFALIKMMTKKKDGAETPGELDDQRDE